MSREEARQAGRIQADVAERCAAQTEHGASTHTHPKPATQHPPRPKATSHLAQHIVSQQEGILQRSGLPHNIQQTVIGNYNQSVHVLAQRLNPVGSLEGPAPALKAEGVGDHAHSQHTQVLGEASHHRGCPGAGAAAHAGSDEDLRGRGEERWKRRGRRKEEQEERKEEEGQERV